nr:MAG TPA: hypothetical protein [Caudoviricetes sp.]
MQESVFGHEFNSRRLHHQTCRKYGKNADFLHVFFLLGFDINGNKRV